MNTNEGGANIRKQTERLLEYMRNHKGVTRFDGMHLGIANVPEIIRRLKGQGHTISDEWEMMENQFGEMTRHKRYYLIREAAA